MSIRRSSRWLMGAAMLGALALPRTPLAAQATATPPRTATRPARQPKVAPVPSPTSSAPKYIKEFGTMWTFDAPPLDYWRTTYGFDADQAWLDHVRLSALRIPGCSASFVSSRGLVMTNHHCGRGCTDAVSPKDTNYIETGFAAPAATDERKCPGMWADQLQSIEDVTARVRGAMTAPSASAQVAQRDAAIEKIEGECKAQAQLECQVVTLYQGGRYSLYRFRRFTDLRLVMAPEEGIAFFGGDPDNFTYPRYDLDLTLLRVYENGQPYQPKDWLHWSAGGASEGELVFVVGNPGSTGRLATAAQMAYLRDVQYPNQLRGYERQLAAYDSLGRRDAEKRRRYQNAVFSLANSRKAVGGYYVGLVDSTIQAKKRAFERDFRARVNDDPALRARYGATWTNIEAAERELTSFAVQYRYENFLGGSTLLALAGNLVRLPVQAALPDALRIPKYRGAGLDSVRANLAKATVDPEFERLVLADYFRTAQKELPAGDPFLRHALGGKSPAQAADALVRGTKVGDSTFRAALVQGGAAAVRASSDPLIALARWIEPTNRRLAMRAARLDATVAANAQKVGEAIFAAYGTTLPPDATFSIRISDGVVKGYPYNGTIAPWKTTFYGLYGHSASFDDKPPFDLPKRWADPARKARLDMATQYDIVSTNDIIGGNSGSPMINRRGEVVGLIFDGNIESLPNRFIFTDDVARSVSVSSQGIVEALRVMYDGARIADELQGR